MENHHDLPKSKTKSYIQTAGLLFILMVLPLGSWYYLSSGLNYQKAARAELKQYGSLPPFQFFDQYDKIITADTLKGKLVLASFFSPNSSETESRFNTLKALHEQFDDRKKIWFVQHLLPGDSSNEFDLSAFIKKIDFEDRGQIYYLNGAPNVLKNVLTKGYKMPQEDLPKNEDGEVQLMSSFPESFSDYPYFVLMDKKGVIRNYYDSRKPGEMKRLVEHMSFIMPREK